MLSYCVSLFYFQAKNDPISMSQAQVCHTWPNCGEITSSSYKDTVFTRFSGHCQLWPWPLTFWPPQKLMSTSMNPKASLTKIGWYSFHWLLRYGVQKVFGSLPAVTLTFDLFTLKSNKHIYEPKYIFDQNWAKFPLFVFEIWCSQCLKDAQIHVLTHSLTDGQIRTQNASGTIFDISH